MSAWLSGKPCPLQVGNKMLTLWHCQKLKHRSLRARKSHRPKASICTSSDTSQKISPFRKHSLGWKTAVLIQCCKWVTWILQWSLTDEHTGSSLAVVLSIGWGGEGGYGEIGVENWCPLIGWKRTQNRASAKRDEGRLVERVIRC